MSEEPVAPIIPIGTRGRPGRGSRTTASAAARGLAGKKPAKAPAARLNETLEASAPEEAPGTDFPQEHRRRDDPRKSLRPGAFLGAEATDVNPAAVPSAPSRHLPLDEVTHALGAAAREVFGEDWERELAKLLAFLRRRLTGDYVVDEFGYDQELTERFLMAAVRPLKDSWFRIEVRGIENIPAEGGALLVSNHSGTFPIDSVMTMAVVQDETGRPLRSLAADLVFRTPFLASLARKGGATLACAEDAERLLSNGELVGVWPEGYKGVGKPFSERYKLQRFGRGGFVSAALRTGVPIVPLSVVGAEEIYPMIGNAGALARILGLPYLPITPFLPLLGPLGLVPLPSKWLMEFGEPIRTDEYDAESVDDPMLVFNLTDQVRETIQQTLYTLLAQRTSVFR